MTLRTTTHSYPTEELDAMVTFYGGKRSVITQQTVSVQWAHILDADLDSTNSRVRPHNYCHSLVLNAAHWHSLNGC